MAVLLPELRHKLTERIPTALSKQERLLLEAEVAMGDHDSVSAALRHYFRRGLEASGVDHLELMSS